MLEFRAIDIEQIKELCIQFRTDSFACSFGSSDRFYEDDGGGAERYIKWLMQQLSDIPGSCVHVFEADRIIGQVEMSLWKKDSRIGYVNLFYLIPNYRGQGLGVQLDKYAASFFQKLGCELALLSVRPTNVSAMKFYTKHGWIDVGTRTDMPEVHYFRKSYKHSSQRRRPADAAVDSQNSESTP